MKPEAATLYKQRYEVQQGAGRPEHCLPHSIPDQMFYWRAFATGPDPGRDHHAVGRVHALPNDLHGWSHASEGPEPDVVRLLDRKLGWGHLRGGYAGFNDKSWLDDGGDPHTEAMHTIEKFRRPDFGHLRVEVTIDDPGAYEKPVTLLINFRYLVDTVLTESICDNEMDAQHQVGK
jgi:hypothetical protein